MGLIVILLNSDLSFLGMNPQNKHSFFFFFLFKVFFFLLYSINNQFLWHLGHLNTEIYYIAN